MIRAASTLLVLLLVPRAATGDSFVVPLESVTGDYYFGTEFSTFSKSAFIDFGFAFERIDSVSLSVSGAGSCPGEPCLRATDFNVSYTGLNPPFGDPPVFLPHVNVGPFDNGFSVYVDLPLTRGFEDGIGFLSITLGLTSREELGPSAPGTISEASLEVVGVLLPEPSSSLLGLAAIMAIAVCRRRTTLQALPARSNRVWCDTPNQAGRSSLA